MVYQSSGDEVSVLVLPAWLPGSYMIRDFSKNLSDISVVDPQGNILGIHKKDKQTWHVDACTGEVTVSYRVYAWDMSVRTAYIDQTRAYFNGSSLFLRLMTQESLRHQLFLESPQAFNWTVSTTMPKLNVDEQGFGVYEVSDYDEFIDYPFEIGNQQSCSFTISNVEHQMVFSDAIDCDLQRIAQDVSPICAEHVAMFGELPVQQYLFMTLATADGYGGLEHCDSTSLICKRMDLPHVQMVTSTKGYRQFLALCSHEYFHLWNVKRIKPAVFQNNLLTEETHTELLWAFEGITSYYDELALVRSGRLDAKEYLGMLAPTVTRVIRAKGRFRQTVAESSFDAWTKFYKQDENSPNAICSYYAKGGLVAFGLDHLLRTESSDRLCLDDLMRHLWRKFGKTQTGIPERGIEHEVSELLGQPVDAFFSAYIYGTEELPLKDWFADFGIGYRLTATDDLTNLGGYSSDLGESLEQKPSFGARTAVVNGMLHVQQVFTGGAAQQAGVAPGDILLALDKEQCTHENLLLLLGRKSFGKPSELTLFRRNRLMTLSYIPTLAELDTCQLWLLDDVDKPVMARRQSWFSSSVSGKHT